MERSEGSRGEQSSREPRFDADGYLDLSSVDMVRLSPGIPKLLDDVQLGQLATRIIEQHEKRLFGITDHALVTSYSLKDLKTELTNILFATGKSKKLEISYQYAVARRYLDLQSSADAADRK